MKVLVITSRVPFPLEKGDKLRIFNQIKHLNKEHEVIVCAIDTDGSTDASIQEVQKHCSQLHILKIPKWKIVFQLMFGFFSKLPFQVSYFYSKGCQKQLDEIINATQPDFVYSHLIRTSEYVKNLPMPKLLDYMDAFSVGIERRIEKQYFFIRWIFNMEFQRLKRYEADIYDYFDAHSIISTQDRNFINHPKRNEIKIIPNGIDTEFFQQKTSEKKFDLLFSGNMNYPPNVEAAAFIAKNIIPLLRTEFPNVKLLIAGADPHPQVKALASAHVFVSGWVDDIRDCYNESRIFIAPMQIGTGLQNKLLEAMAMKLPCITSELANNSLNAGVNTEVLIGESPEEYANHVKILLKDELKSSILANKGHEFVINNYGWESSNAALSSLIKKTISK